MLCHEPYFNPEPASRPATRGPRTTTHPHTPAHICNIRRSSFTEQALPLSQLAEQVFSLFLRFLVPDLCPLFVHTPICITFSSHCSVPLTSIVYCSHCPVSLSCHVTVHLPLY